MSPGSARRLIAASGAVMASSILLAACGSSPAKPTVRAHLAGIPATIGAGGPAIEFTARLTNRSGATEYDIAPLFQVVGGQCNCAVGTLKRLDSANGNWQPTPMPEGDGDPNYLAKATGGVTLRAGASITFHYQLILDAGTPVGSLRAVLYAVQLPAGTQLALTSVSTQFTSG